MGGSRRKAQPGSFVLIGMSSDADEDITDPADVVAAMASAVEHVRQMATHVFEGDAALFGDRMDGPSK